MSSYQFTPQAVDDLLDIWSFIANDKLDAADRVEVEDGFHRYPSRFSASKTCRAQFFQE